MGEEFQVGHTNMADVTQINGVKVRHASGDCLPPINNMKSLRVICTFTITFCFRKNPYSNIAFMP